MVIREGQIRLCHMMLDALFGRDVALYDAGIGLGKTYAYLVACMLWQLQRPRQMATSGSDFHRQYRPSARYSHRVHTAFICDLERYSRSCILHFDCRYRQYLKDSNDASVTIRVCNHNYLLADAVHRQNGWKSLLKGYQALVIDEAHKLPETVRQMNTRRIRSSDLLHFERILTTSHCTLGT